MIDRIIKVCATVKNVEIGSYRNGTREYSLASFGRLTGVKL